MKTFVRRLFLALIGLVVVGGIGYGLRPPAVEVDMATAHKGSLRVTVDEDGKTRIRERYIVSAPLAGRMLRIDKDPGDGIVAGQTLLATIEPRDPDLLDARTLLQAEANVKAARANLERMTPLLEESLANQELAEAELRRDRETNAAVPGSVSASQLEASINAYRARSAQVRSAQHAEEIARFELEQARAALARTRPTPRVDGEGDQSTNQSNDWNSDDELSREATSQHLLIHAPINGRVLRIFQESSAYVLPGAQLLELGDPNDLEIEVDVLSRDAVQIREGADVTLEHWGGDMPLKGRVRLVEPSAFTKISTLGVEEQRVNVIVDLLDPPQQRAALGDGFRVEARIVVAQAHDVLKIPTSALFRTGQTWAVFRANAGHARQCEVSVGLQNGLEAEIREGLVDGDQVIVHPSDDVTEGASVVSRE